MTFFLKWVFWMILFREEAILASSISKFGKSWPATDHDDFNSSKESTISTSLIHNIASASEYYQSCQITPPTKKTATHHQPWNQEQANKLSILTVSRPGEFFRVEANEAVGSTPGGHQQNETCEHKSKGCTCSAKRYRPVNTGARAVISHMALKES